MLSPGDLSPPHNVLVCGDASDILERACRAGQPRNAIRMAYVDPPFRSHEVFPALGAGARTAWEAMLRTTLRHTRALLAPGASIWLHIDPPHASPCDDVLADELGRGARIAWVHWERGAPWDRDHLIAYAPDVRGARERRETWCRADVGDVFEGRREVDALFPGRDAFPHPKPERLLARIIDLTSATGDLVLDPFSGSGTAAAVAHKKRRRWLAIERDRDIVECFTRPRLTRVIRGCDPGGVTAAACWEGGGRFLYVRPGQGELIR